jgi:hypothetical protein
MAEDPPSRSEAVAALAEAGLRASQVRQADPQLRWMLLAMLGVYGGVALLLSLSPHQGTNLTAVGLIVLPTAALAFIVVVAVRIRAYSRRGIRLYFGAVIAFNLWNALVTSVSIGTRFWALGAPSYHFGISAAVGVIPLLIGVWLLSRSRV